MVIIILTVTMLISPWLVAYGLAGAVPCFSLDGLANVVSWLKVWPGLPRREGFLREVSNLRNEVDLLSTSLRSEKHQVAGLTAQLGELGRELEGERGDREVACERAGMMERELAEARERQRAQEEMLAVRAEEVMGLQTRLEEVEERLVGAEGGREELRGGLVSARDELERLKGVEEELAASKGTGDALCEEVRRLVGQGEGLARGVREGEERERGLQERLGAAEGARDEVLAQLTEGEDPGCIRQRQAAATHEHATE